MVDRDERNDTSASEQRHIFHEMFTGNAEEAIGFSKFQCCKLEILEDALLNEIIFS